jgi:hypothetical protein
LVAEEEKGVVKDDDDDVRTLLDVNITLFSGLRGSLLL